MGASYFSVSLSMPLWKRALTARAIRREVEALSAGVQRFSYECIWRYEGVGHEPPLPRRLSQSLRLEAVSMENDPRQMRLWP
jgi:hypothetical protein